MGQSTLDYQLISQAAAAAFAAARLLHFHLRQRFPFLLFYLVVYALTSGASSFLPRDGNAYFWTYLTTELIVWITAILAVSEMFSLIFKNYPGLRTAGKWAFYAALVASVAVSIVIGVLSPGVPVPQKVVLHYELILDRSINISLALTIGVLMRFLSKYPLHLERNTYVCSGFFSAVFLADAAIKLFDGLTAHMAMPRVDNLEVAFTAVCLVGWGIMLKAAPAAAAPRVPADKPREIELLQQLESMNKILSRSLRQ